MNHDYIKEQDTIEKYILHQLSDSEEKAFQEHLFFCEECQKELEATKEVINVIRFAAIEEKHEKNNVISDESQEEKVKVIPLIYKLSVAASILFCITTVISTGYFTFRIIPNKTNEYASKIKERDLSINELKVDTANYGKSNRNYFIDNERLRDENKQLSELKKTNINDSNNVNNIDYYLLTENAKKYEDSCEIAYAEIKSSNEYFNNISINNKDVFLQNHTENIYWGNPYPGDIYVVTIINNRKEIKYSSLIGPTNNNLKVSFNYSFNERGRFYLIIKLKQNPSKVIYRKFFVI